MRYSQSEKMEIIRLVEESELPVSRTLRELEVPRSSFYRWYRSYQEEGYKGLSNKPLMSVGYGIRSLRKRNKMLWKLPWSTLR